VTASAALRIAIVAPYDLSTAGGVNNQIRAQAAALRRRGHGIQIFGPASGPLTNGERSLGRTISVTVSGTESGLGVDPRAIRTIARMRRESFDVIHIHEPMTPIVPWLVLLQSTAPLVGTFHVHREEGHRLYALSAWALRPLARRLRARIAVSDAARRTVEPHFPGTYEIVPNGIDVDWFREPRPRPPALADSLRYVLYVGRLEPRKGVEYLIRAMATVQRTTPEIALVVIGDGQERASLTALARDLGALVHFVGRAGDEELPAYFQAADIVCSPALGGESFGIVLLEAMACGTPIVASRIDGYAALVGSSGCAQLVTPGDADGLARGLVELLQSPDERRVMGARGALAARAYDWTAIAERLEGIYRRSARV
jgi:phosphatidylinositol alpha-mannosyltransferase